MTAGISGLSASANLALSVIVAEDGFQYNGRTYRSLSTVALTVTGPIRASARVLGRQSATEAECGSFFRARTSR